MSEDVLQFPCHHRQSLEPFLPPPGHTAADGTNPAHTLRPHVTLTYAASLDSMIAAAPGTRTALSGKESKSMTHYLRTRHDAILVGCGTVNADDPTLNSRLQGATSSDQPRPVILDGRGHWRMSRATKVLQAARENKGKQPWIITAAARSDFPERFHNEFRWLRMDEEELTWPLILQRLASEGIRSVMIEGGAGVIQTLLRDHVDLIHSLIVTIAPTYLGVGGLSVISGHSLSADVLHDVKWLTLGRDAVMCSALQHEAIPVQ